jgi:hypothetical protein
MQEDTLESVDYEMEEEIDMFQKEDKLGNWNESQNIHTMGCTSPI